jgi:hypothetical protein
MERINTLLSAGYLAYFVLWLILATTTGDNWIEPLFKAWPNASASIAITTILFAILFLPAYPLYFLLKRNEKRIAHLAATKSQ